jgi:serine/threonine-protein kinase RsbT
MADILTARKAGRERAMAAGFKTAEVTLIVAAISEVARNIVEYAHDGEVRLKIIQRGMREGLEITASDNGPGIRDLKAAMHAGYGPNSGGAMGLSSARWMMDTFAISSKPGRGTKVVMVKWLS